MNSGSGSAMGGLRDLARLAEREASGETRDGEESAALWVALAQRVSSAQAVPLLASPEEPPSAWRGSAGDLTPGAALTASAGGAPAEASAQERIVVRVDGGELGELEVTLDREHGALRVVIGLQNEQLARSVAPDAETLRRALTGAGINLRSLNVVPASEVGIVLARHRLSPSGPKPESPPTGEPEQQTDEARRRQHKRLTLIG